MFRISSIMNESRDKVSVYDLNEDSHNNYYTILTGDNASGKSSLLSKAINFFLFDNKKDDYLEPAISLDLLSERSPSKIIALCNSRFDKFTSNLYLKRRSFAKKFAMKSMFYIHPEVNDNPKKGITDVVNQCVKNSLRQNESRDFLRNKRVNEAFSMFGLQSQLHLKCAISTNNLQYILAILSSLINGKMILSDNGITYRRKENFFLDSDLDNRNNTLDESIEFVWREVKNEYNPNELYDILLMIQAEKISAGDLGDVYFSIAEGRIYTEGKSLLYDFGEMKIIRHLFILDVFYVLDLQVMHSDSNKEVSMVSLSSGQRTLFGHAIVLSSFSENNCMICIDEPENSLHPEWQLNFMRFISLLCPDTLGAHIFIATHSPQIISGMQFDNGCVLSLANKNIIDSITIRKDNKYFGDRFYELQPLRIYREQSADKQLTGVFKSPGYKNDFIIRKLLLILSKLSKKIELTHNDDEFLSQIVVLIEKNRVPDGDPVQFLVKQIMSFQRLRAFDDQ